MTNHYILDFDVSEPYLYLFYDGACHFVTSFTYLGSKNSSIYFTLLVDSVFIIYFQLKSVFYVLLCIHSTRRS